jgi:hypothetical protein
MKVSSGNLQNFPTLYGSFVCEKSHEKSYKKLMRISIITEKRNSTSSIKKTE